jgi:hypothetical protein
VTIDNAICGGIAHILDETLLPMVSLCNSSGAELWRTLRAKWQGTSKQIQIMATKEYHYPPNRSKDMISLWNDLEEWMRKGRDAKAAGLIGDNNTLESHALDLLMPQVLFNKVVEKEDIKDEFLPKLAWVRRQMEEHRGKSQAHAKTEPAPKHSGAAPMDLGNLENWANDELGCYRQQEQEWQLNSFQFQQKGKGGGKPGGKTGFRPTGYTPNKGTPQPFKRQPRGKAR